MLSRKNIAGGNPLPPPGLVGLRPNIISAFVMHYHEIEYKYLVIGFEITPKGFLWTKMCPSQDQHVTKEDR